MNKKEEVLQDLENHTINMIGKFIELCDKQKQEIGRSDIAVTDWGMTHPVIVEEYFPSKLDAFIVGVNLGRMNK